MISVVLAITCYTCTPNPPTVSCTTLADLNVTDCDADPTVPSGMADVCSKRLAVAKMGQMNRTMNMFSCGTKVSFDTAQLKNMAFSAKLVKFINVIQVKVLKIS